MNQSSNQDELRASKVDWSTPFDEWLIPLLNRARHCGPIEFRALPSVVQKNFEEYVESRFRSVEDIAASLPTPYKKRKHHMRLGRLGTQPTHEYTNGISVTEDASFAKGYNQALKEVQQALNLGERS